MKQIMKYSWGCLLALVPALIMSSCEDEETVGDLTSAVMPASIELIVPAEVQQYIYTDENGAKVLPMLKGETIQMDYGLQPENVTYPDVIWTSTVPSVATVEDGLVTAVEGNGESATVIQVAPEGMYSGSGIYDNVRVVVSNTLVQAEEITIDAPADQVYAGETLQLTATILPEDATYRTVSWSSSNESVATVDQNGLVTGVVNDEVHASVTITATSLDGAQVFGTKTLTVNQIVQPENITIDQMYAAANGYYCAIADGSLNLNFTTEPADCTASLIEWTSSDESIATVENGVITFNQDGNFGDFTITATCPETGNSSSIQMSMPAGLVRELFHNEDNYTWYNASQSGNGTQSSHVWHDGYITVTTYTQNATAQRGDLKCWSPKTYLHAGNYPIFAIRMDDVADKYASEGVTARNITLDASGDCDGTKFSGGLNGNNNKWLHDYKCSDGSHVFIYDLSTQKWATGGTLPANAVATFTTFQFKYADIKTIDHQIEYNVYWVQTFKTLEEVATYIQSEGLTYEVVK